MILTSWDILVWGFYGFQHSQLFIRWRTLEEFFWASCRFLLLRSPLLNKGDHRYCYNLYRSLWKKICFKLSRLVRGRRNFMQMVTLGDLWPNMVISVLFCDGKMINKTQSQKVRVLCRNVSNRYWEFGGLEKVTDWNISSFRVSMFNFRGVSLKCPGT